MSGTTPEELASEAAEAAHVSSDERRRQLEDARTTARADLTATVEELAAFLDPKTQASRAAERGKRLLHDATSPSAAAEDRRRARVVLGVAAAVTAAVVAGLVGRRGRR